MGEEIYDEVGRFELSEMDRGERLERTVVIYESADALRAQETSTTSEFTNAWRKTTTQNTVDRTKSRCSRLAAVCFGLLCVLLLIINIVLYMNYIKKNQEKENLSQNILSLTEERETYLSNIKNITKERNQLKSSYQNLTEEREQVKNNCTKEKKSITNKYRSLTEEIVTLQTRHQQTFLNYICLHCFLVEKSCFKHWEKNGKSFYFFSSEKKNWHESKEDCRQRGADLVIINNKEEQVFLNKPKRNFWIGLTDEDRESVWKWVDGQPQTDKYWREGEPNDNGGKEDCAVFNSATPKTQHTWNDIECSVKENWVCEFNHTNCK